MKQYVVTMIVEALSENDARLLLRKYGKIILVTSEDYGLPEESSTPAPTAEAKVGD